LTDIIVPIDFRNLELPASFDTHAHLRDGTMSELVVPTIRQVNQVYVLVSTVY
jgi:dihydroorotase